MSDLTWTGVATALSSISHGSETRGLTTMLRRETILSPDGELVSVPLISGNTFRGKLRRVSEQMLGEVLPYRGKLSVAAAAALRSGGALTKSSQEPISGKQLARLRELVPVIAIFGSAGAGRIIDGCLQVGKLMPIATETAHIHEHPARRSVRDMIQIESYSRVDDVHTHDAEPDDVDGASTQLRFRLETFRAGSTFDVWLNLVNPSEVESAFFADVLARFSQSATVAGRSGIGHGRLKLDLSPSSQPATTDWKARISSDADEAINLLNRL